VSAFVTILQTFGAAESPQGIAALGIDPLAILAQAGTFLVLFFIIKKFALDKIVSTLEERRKTIDDGVRLGREMEAEKERLSDEISQELHKARAEADDIIAQSREEAGVIVREAQEAALRKTEAMLEDAHAKIEEDILKARVGLQKEIMELVADATAVIAEEKIDAKKDATMIERALARVRSV
jgi:F-type H+-transporting ATPase subunit b